MSRRSRRVAKHENKAAHHVSGATAGLDPGMVMVNNRTGLALDRNETIDLEEEQKLAGGTPSFSTQPADPMRPFRNSAMCAGSSYLPDKLGMETPEEIGVRAAIADQMEKLRPDQRERVLSAMDAARSRGWTNGYNAGINSMSDGKKYHPGPDEVALLKEMMEWSKPPFRLGRVQESTYHKTVSAYKDGSLMMPAFDDGEAVFPRHRYETITTCISGLVPETGIFLLQHDWASAFAKAVDYQGGELHIPYALTVLECRLNDHRVSLVICEPTKNNPTPICIIHVEMNGRIGLLGTAEFSIGDFKVIRKTSKLMEGVDDIADVLLSQTRAVLIALESEVATSDVIRAPYKLNQKRERAGKLPIFDYHVVNLAARKRYAPRLPEPGDHPTEHRGKRLHFVRGHWRHYSNVKTWVKWHLRGDPDLGFVDKEYRL